MVSAVNEEIIIIYSSPAFPPSDIDIKKSYKFGEDKDGVYIISDGEKEYKKIDFIKAFFKPLDKEWKDVLKIKSSK